MKRSAYRNRRPAELFAGAFFLDVGGDHRDSVFVAGSGRSGTTWLSSLVNHDERYRFVFEPFHPERVAECRGFLRKQYLRPDDDRPEYLEPARRILCGETRSSWTDRFNRKLVARKRLVKDIRANLLLGWLRRNFQETPTLLLLRHPCAVAESRLRLGWKDHLEETVSQKPLVEDHLKPFEKHILAAEDPFERSVFLWCVENFTPLRQPGAENIHVVFYENLLTDPEGELAPVFDFLGENVGGEFPKADPRRAFEWTSRVDDARRRRAAEILRLFGLDRIYGEEPEPRVGGLPAFFESRG